MMSKLGWILMLAGILIPLSIFTGVAPVNVALSLDPIPTGAWIGLAAVGGFLVMINRRPSN